MKSKILLCSLITSSILISGCSSNSANNNRSDNKTNYNSPESTTSTNKTESSENTEKLKQNSKEIAKQNGEHFKKNKQKFDTGLTYEQIAREPDAYKNKKVLFNGKILQVVKNDLYTTLRVAVNGNYKNVILVIYTDSATEKKLLEDDNITIYGIFHEETSYISTSGVKITLPQINGLYIELNNI